MAVVNFPKIPNTRGASELSHGRTNVRPFPGEGGGFIIERENGMVSYVRQGIARIGGATIRYTLEKPQATDDQIPLILVPGYGGIKPAYRELRKAVVSGGKAAVTFKPPRAQEKFAGLHPKHALHPERLLAQAVLGVSRDVIMRNGEKDGYNQVDTAGHSMGGPAVVNAGLVAPKMFRSAILMGAAGLDGHTLRDMRERAPSVLREEVLPSLNQMRVKKDVRSVRNIVEYVARNPWRTLAEGLAVGSGDIRDKVSRIGELGIRTATQQYAQDRFFPEAGVREHSASRFDYYHVFPDPEAGHMAPQMQPEAVGEDLLDILAVLHQSERPAIAANL